MAVIKVLSSLLLFLLLFYVLRPSSPLVTLAIFLMWPLFILLLTAILVPYLWQILDRLIGPIDSKGKAILITGCDYGFGYKTALSLNKAGFHIFAGCLDSKSQGAVELKKLALYPGKMDIVQLDVTNDEQIHRAHKFICDRLQKDDSMLYGLLNNAGIFTPCCLEFGRFEEEHLTMFNVNLFGVFKVTRAFLPLIRKSQGRIVTMSSLSSRQYFPYFGTYSMSKAAVKSFIENLRHEMFPFKVKVISIEPSFAGTSMPSAGRIIASIEKSWKNTDEEVKQAYGPNTVQRASTALEYPTSSMMQVDSVFNETLKAIMDAFTCHEPDIHYTIVPFYFKPLIFLRQISLEFFAFHIERFLLKPVL